LPKIDLDAIPETNATGYPAPLREAMAGRVCRRLGPAGGLTDFGVSRARLEPGGISSQRHWHEGEDEFVVMLSGAAVLEEEGTRTPMAAGDCAAFPKGVPNGHRLVNESDAPCVFVAIGQPSKSPCHYPDVDLYLDGETPVYRHKDGTAY
jgi:uncharacterized cupin superfamily protein